MDTAEILIIPKPAYNILRRLTGETRPDVALSLAIKDLLHFRLDAARSLIAGYEEKYQMPFRDFQKKWHAGQIADAYSYPVEQDYFSWESAITDLAVLEELAASVI